LEVAATAVEEAEADTLPAEAATPSLQADTSRHHLTRLAEDTPEAVEAVVTAVLWEAEAMVEAVEDTLAQHNHPHQCLRQQHQCRPNQLLWHHHHPAAKAATNSGSSAERSSWLQRHSRPRQTIFVHIVPRTF
ncbi:hypothetical protein OESDEN_15602, partial [Oesophagostomum dentatum]